MKPADSKAFAVLSSTCLRPFTSMPHCTFLVSQSMRDLMKLDTIGLAELATVLHLHSHIMNELRKHKPGTVAIFTQVAIHAFKTKAAIAPQRPHERTN